VLENHIKGQRFVEDRKVAPFGEHCRAGGLHSLRSGFERSQLASIALREHCDDLLLGQDAIQKGLCGDSVVVLSADVEDVLLGLVQHVKAATGGD
jgi:hypothetical protein